MYIAAAIMLLARLMVATAQDAIVARVGSSVTLPCTSPVQDIRWLCYGCVETLVVSVHEAPETPLLEHIRGLSSVFHKYGRISLVPGSLALKYDPVLVSDSGRYLCQLANGTAGSGAGRAAGAGAGDDRTGGVITLLVQDVPSVPARPLVTSFTSRDVTLSWSPSVKNNNSPILHYIVRVREGETGNWSGRPVITPDNSTNIIVRNLRPFTAFSFRLTAVNSIGQSTTGPESFPIITLREVPGAAPELVAAHNLSDSSILLQWRQLPVHQLRGEFLAYIITCSTLNQSRTRLPVVRIEKQAVQTYTLRGLQAFTTYNVCILVENSMGSGPETSVLITTAEGVSGPPRDVTASLVTSDSVTVTWRGPARPNGVLQGYRLFYTRGNFTNATTVHSSQPHISYRLTQLDRLTEYSISISGFTRSAEGHTSAPLIVTTDTGGGPGPLLQGVRCGAGGTLLVLWSPVVHQPSGTRYRVQYRRADTESTSWNSQQITTNNINNDIVNNRTQHTFVLNGLERDVVYELRLLSETHSLYNTSLWLESRPSAVLHAAAGHVTCQLSAPAAAAPAPPRHRHGTGHQSAGTALTAAAGAVCFCSALALTLLAITVYRRYFRLPYGVYEAEETRSVGEITRHLSGDEEESWERDAPRNSTVPAPIPVELLQHHLHSLMYNAGAELAIQFEEIQSHSDKLTLGSHISKRDENKTNNRYHNIHPYDHSLVPIRCGAGGGGVHRPCNYINASYVDGYQVRRRYIATQAPLPDGLHIFWRMVWQQDVHVVVALTKLIEANKVKCDQYWPSEGVQQYGNMMVELLEQRTTATYTCRKFLLKQAKRRMSGVKCQDVSCDTQRQVTHLQFTAWPDHGVPDDPLPLLQFVRKTSTIYQQNFHHSPVLVHCSGGVGRTGVYMVLDSMLAMLARRGAINPFGYLRHARAQRRQLLQTPEQYRLVHEALHQALVTGVTELSPSQLAQSAGIDESLLRHQFQLAVSYVPCDEELVSARAAFDQGRNRLQSPLSADRWRVHLTPRQHSSSDYINATFLPGYRRQQEFIVAQHPLHSTVTDFWTMVRQNDVQTVIVLSPSDDAFVGFWPLLGSEMQCGNLRVQRSNCSETSDIYSDSSDIWTAELRLMSDPAASDLQQSVRMSVCPAWWSRDPVSCVRQLYVSERNTSPVVVVDRYGGRDAAMFCCLAAILDQLDSDNVADVYFYTRMFHERRPGIWNNADEYIEIHRLLQRAYEGSMEERHQLTFPTPDGRTVDPLWSDDYLAWSAE